MEDIGSTGTKKYRKVDRLHNKKDISNRMLDFSIKIIRLTDQMKKTASSSHAGLQVVRSATSAGANYEEACSAQSRADFVHKLQIVLKELKESLYLLNIIRKADFITTEYYMDSLIGENKELTNIIAKSIITVKRNNKKRVET